MIIIEQDRTRAGRRDLLVGYVCAAIFLTLLWLHPDFITGIYLHPFGKYARCGYVHLIHTAFLLATALYSIYLLNRSQRALPKQDIRRQEHRYLIVGLCFVLLGSVDFLQNWGASYFPFGCIFVGVFVAMTTYAIFKHQLLGVTAVARQTVAYTLVTTAVICLYFVTVYVTTSLVGDTLLPNSPWLNALVLVVVTLLFRPLESIAQSIVRKLFGRDDVVLMAENKRLKSEIVKQDHMRSIATLAAGMAHEIKNPLTAIKTFTEHLPAKASDPVFLDKFHRVVGQEVDKIDSIVRQVLEFSRPQAQLTDGVDLNSIVDSTLELLNAQMVRARIVLDRQLEPELPLLRADRKLLQQALLNILINAIEAMPQGGQLRVETSIDRGEVRITITDTGLGIPSSALPRIFDPFYTNKETGTGLGLAIVKGIIDQHGGKISVRSAKGEGASFEMRLPAL
ncbi:MAG: Adaptive-response sensory-kinase SasA [Candidatus Omnitrophica bacterium]|nr:Adaptive-response sensory-kinase SasA [Candidatus Omnitrophota bacterium]